MKPSRFFTFAGATSVRVFVTLGWSVGAVCSIGLVADDDSVVAVRWSAHSRALFWSLAAGYAAGALAGVAGAAALDARGWGDWGFFAAVPTALFAGMLTAHALAMRLGAVDLPRCDALASAASEHLQARLREHGALVASPQEDLR